MPTNAEMLKRADIAISELASNGGKLDPTQANSFIDEVQEQPTILQQARVIRMPAPQHKINRIGFASRILKAAPQGTAPYAQDDGSNNRWLAAADRSKIGTSQIMLTTKEIMAEVHVPYEVYEDNIEGESLEDTIMRHIAMRTAQDLEDWVLNADTGSGDAFYALNDGLIKTATSNVVNNLSAGLTPDTFESGMLAMPQKYLRDLGQLRHFVPVADAIRYQGNVARRATGYGDSSLTSDGKLYHFGVPVDRAPLMPASTALFTYPQNMLFGIQRDITVETDRDIRAREWIIVLTIRCDAKWDDEAAVVKYTNL